MAQAPLQYASYKRIIICIDGTWQGSENDSNVVRMSRAIAPIGVDKETKHLVPQIKYYRRGVGSGDVIGQRLGCGAFGWGIERDICDAYEFLSDNYKKGDELFFFGFSRGAFTVRSLAGLISDVGLLRPEHMWKFQDLWKSYIGRNVDQKCREQAWYMGHYEDLVSQTDIKVVGVWDTVSGLGVVKNLIGKATRWILGINFDFHNKNPNHGINNAFQALSIDENRKVFPPVFWELGEESLTLVKECWFPGVHGDVGGQKGDGDSAQIGAVSFAWMVGNISEMLSFKGSVIDGIVHAHSDANGVKWGKWKIVHGSYDRFFRHKSREIRGIASKYALDQTRLSIHPSARVRWSHPEKPRWRPAALDGWTPKEIGKGGGWVKTDCHLPECTDDISLESSMVCMNADNEPAEGKGMSWRLCPAEYRD